MPAFRRLLLLLALSLQLSAFSASACAAEPVELGADLGYLRIHSIVQERQSITDALHQSRALVLDLRYPVDERDAGEILSLELRSHPAKPRTYVLLSPSTPVPVVGVIAANPAPFLVTLGIENSKPEPSVVVAQTAAADRAAYEAYAAGTTLAQLVSGHIEKERFDEASLVQEFKNGNLDAKPPEASPAKAAETPAPPTDRVLQRALHLHRALQALKRG